MTDQWDTYVHRLAELVRPGPLGAGPALSAAPGVGGPVLLCAPHPDDEAICGALALRLRREAGCRVVVLAMTLGSDPARRPARWQELTDSCQVLGFEPRRFEPAGGPVSITPAQARRSPRAWQAMVEGLLDVLDEIRPILVIHPHRGDGHPTHVGVARLVREALRAWSRKSPILAAESECWTPLRRPNCVVGCLPVDVATLCRALACHTGEVSRNPFHRHQPVRMLDTAFRAAELVGGFGGRPYPFLYADAYRLLHWTAGRCRPVPVTVLPCDQPLTLAVLAGFS